MSPLQFQKGSWLYKVRHLMLDEKLDATREAALVGYKAPAHFNRDGTTIFGRPPMRDVQRLRKEN